MNHPFEDSLTKFKKCLMEAAPFYVFEFDNSADTIAKFYEELEHLRNHGPEYIMKLDRFSEGMDIVHEPMKGMLKATQEAFNLLEEESELKRQLNALLALCKSETHQRIPGASELAHAAERLLVSTDSINKPLSLSMSLSPSLDLNTALNEERQEDNGEISVGLDIALTNTGEKSIAEVIFQSDDLIGANFQLAMENPQILPLSDGVLRIHLESTIKAGETQVIRLNVKYPKEVEISIVAKYIGFPNTGEEKTIGPLKIKLPFPANVDWQTLHNPYIPDIPLNIEWQWNKLMRGNHNSIAEEIKAKLYESRKLQIGRVYVLKGLKRTGKTSILNCLQEKLRQTKEFFPVYIDILSWQRSLSERALTITGENLLYELADSAFTEVEYSDTKLSQAAMKEFNDFFSEDGRMSKDQLKDFARALSMALNKSVIFLLDELDWWLNAPEFKDKNLFSQIRELVEKLKGLSFVVVSHELTEHDWDEVYGKADLTPADSWPVKFLEKEDILDRGGKGDLCGLTDLNYTDMAAEFIWRVTGGWEGLVQLLFYRLIEEARREKKPLVNIVMVKKVISDILNSPHDRPFLIYFLKNFSADEIKVLQKLSTSEKPELIRKDNYYIKDVQYLPEKAFKYYGNLPDGLSVKDFEKALASLKRKQIIELAVGQKHRQCRLRVGLLAYPASYTHIIN